MATKVFTSLSQVFPDFQQYTFIANAIYYSDVGVSSVWIPKNVIHACTVKSDIL